MTMSRTAAAATPYKPCVSMPLMGVGGLPVGAQVVGRPGEDAHVTAIARWLIDHVEPVVA